MLITSLISLLLSNSITLWRDKSTFYPGTTITILLGAGFISYYALSFSPLEILNLFLTLSHYALCFSPLDIFKRFIGFVIFILMAINFSKRPLSIKDISGMLGI